MEEHHSTTKLNFEKNINDSEVFRLVSSTYEKTLADIESRTTVFLDPLDKSQQIIMKECIHSLRERYMEITCGLQEGIKDVSTTFDSTDKSNKIEIRRLKRRLNDIMLIVESEKDVVNQFAEIFLKLENKLKNIKLQTLQNPAFKFSLFGKLDVLEWKGLNNHILTVPPGGNSYKCFVTEEIFDYEVTCTIRLNKFQSNFAGSEWMYGFGLLKNGMEINEGTFYDFTAMLQSTGYTNIKFSGSSGNTRITEKWNTGDEITLLRDSSGTMYFSLNKEERVEAFKEVNGAMRVVFAVSSSIIGDEIELIECGPYNV